MILVLALILLHSASPQQDGEALVSPELPTRLGAIGADWLLAKEGFEAVSSTTHTRVSSNGRTTDRVEITLTNGLVRREWRIEPGAATIGLDDLMTGRSLLRGVKAEAVIVVDGIELAVGGLRGQPDYAYLRPEWRAALEPDPGALQLVRYELGSAPQLVGRELLAPSPPFAWKRVRHAVDSPWPAPGQRLSLHFALTPEAAEALPTDPATRAALLGLSVVVHTKLYDGLPLFEKWLEVHNGSTRAITLDSFVSERLAIVESESPVEGIVRWEPPGIEVLSDYAFGGMGPKDSNHTTYWVPDPEYATQVNYQRLSPVLLESRPPIGPGAVIAPGATFTTFRTFELVHDSTDRERRGLARRRMFRTIAPWVTENPLMMHVRSAQPEAVRLAIDQCAEVGFEMVILTFGSGFDMEDEDPAVLAKWKRLADYAHSRGIELGGYSLLSSRKIGPETDVIDAATGLPGGAKFGHAPCLGSEWGLDYFRKLYAFFEATGFDLLEHDGSYPGDTCASQSHPGHRDERDSQWTQWRTITDFYKWCRGRGVFLNVPDFYMLSGSNKTGMGYRETNWSLPRREQILHGRQNIYDGTWDKTPTMGWMFVPLTEYHGGGAAATLEPLSEHLADYDAHFANNLLHGVQACWRGPRLYDTDETRALVANWVDVFKEHRDILESDIVHVRRADGRDLDCMLHVNPRLQRKGFATVFNPLDHTVERTLVLPLYYTGLTGTARIRERGGEARSYELDAERRVRVPVAVEAHGATWLVIE